MKEEVSDKVLLELFRLDSSRNRAFELLIKKYQQKIYWQIRRIITNHTNADDVLQESFIKIWKGLDNFREDAQLYSWMFRIVHNECINWIRKNKNAQITDSINDEQLEALNEISSSDHILDPNAQTIQRKLNEALDTLPEKQRMIFELRYFQELPYAEISKLLGTTEGALKASYHIAVKKIEKFLSDD